MFSSVGYGLESRIRIDAFDHVRPEATALLDLIINQPVLDLAVGQ